MKIFTLVSALVGAFLLIGCSAKSPPALQDSKSLGINNALLEQKYSFVPKDEFLANMNFAYEINAIPNGEYLITNEQMVKIFLLAHNAQKVIIIGDKQKIKAYGDYLAINGVKAENMYLQPLENTENDLVKLLFFNKKGE